jgi:hypothetical protein
MATLAESFMADLDELSDVSEEDDNRQQPDIDEDVRLLYCRVRVMQLACSVDLLGLAYYSTMAYEGPASLGLSPLQLLSKQKFTNHHHRKVLLNLPWGYKSFFTLA